MSLKILISYARADGAVAASKLRDELARDDILTWRDVEQIRAGGDDTWQEQLRTALREVDAVLVLLTPASVGSRWVEVECQVALGLRKVVIPVLICDCSMPDWLPGAHRRDLSRPDTYNAELVSLLRDLRENIWLPVEEDLVALQEDHEYADFLPLLNKLQVLLNGRKYAPEIFKAFIYLIWQMKRDLKQDNQTLRRLLDQAVEGQYVQDFWPIHERFQDNCHIFKALLTEFRERLPEDPATTIFVVLVVMTRAEAEQMDDFQPLHQLLPANWTSRYKETPEEWEPFAGRQEPLTVAQVVGSVLEQTHVPEHSFAPSFVDIRTLNSPEQRPLLRKLRREGCVVVIDSVSIYHEKLQRAFEQTALETYPQTSVVTISPTNNFAELVREMIITFQFRMRDMEFIKRAREEDGFTCEEIVDKDDWRFERWMRNRVSTMYRPSARRGEQPDIRQFFHQNAGERQ